MVAVMDELATNGITHIAIVTDSRHEKQATGKAARGAPAPEARK